jgi:hypothetical protein
MRLVERPSGIFSLPVVLDGGEERGCICSGSDGSKVDGLARMVSPKEGKEVQLEQFQKGRVTKEGRTDMI